MIQDKPDSLILNSSDKYIHMIQDKPNSVILNSSNDTCTYVTAVYDGRVVYGVGTIFQRQREDEMLYINVCYCYCTARIG